MANILLFAMVNHISPASGKPFESAPAGLGIRSTMYPTFPVWLPHRPPIEGTVFRFLTRSKSG
jgi:hypothetical protein